MQFKVTLPTGTLTIPNFVACDTVSYNNFKQYYIYHCIYLL